MLIIGSTAIKYHFPDFKREPKDIDVLRTKFKHPIILDTIFNVNKKIEYLENSILSEKYRVGNYISKDDLCTLKASHLFWDINWDKHMFDLQFLLSKGCIIDKVLWFKLYKYWNEVHSKNKRSDLKMSKEDFFNNAVNYNSGEHDETHKLINPVPIYTKVLKDNSEVELDENKFHKLSFGDKLEFVREEIYVMANERYSGLGYKRAYNKMLKKFIISHAPIFSVIFILENYIELQSCKINFIEIIKNGRKSNKTLNITGVI